MSDDRKLSITYSSGLIPPPEHMSTLAVFYDEIWLPCPYDFNPEVARFFNELLTTQLSIIPHDISRLIMVIRRNLSSAQKYYASQRNQWQTLCDDNILQILPPLEKPEVLKIILSMKYPPEEVFNFDIKSYERADEFDSDSYFMRTLIATLNSSALMMHTFYAHKSSPEIFISDPLDTRTSRLAGFLVRTLFDYKVPQLQTLNAEQILEIRDYLKDAKEGFRYYINELTDDIERRIREHNLSHVEATQKTFERRIQPQYEEFRRKLAAKKTGFWSRVAVAGGKFMQVDATPLSIRFLGAVLELCGISLDEFSKSEQENYLSNKSQAFNYIATLESEVSKL